MDVTAAHDALGCYLTGAESDGGDQSAHCLSLGGYRSASEANGLGVRVRSAIAGVEIDFAAPANGEGIGSRDVLTSNTLAWTPPGGTQGSPTTLSPNTTVLLPGGDPEKYLRVTRTSNTALVGSSTVVLTQCRNTVASGPDEHEPGYTTRFRAIILKNESAYDITNLVLWNEGDTDNMVIALAQEALVDGRMTDLSPLGDVPVTDDWPAAYAAGQYTGQTPATGLQIGTLAAGASVGIWVGLQVGYLPPPTPESLHAIKWQYDIDDQTDVAGEVAGTFAISRDYVERYHLYRGVDGPPDFSTPYQTYSEEPPFTTPAQDTGHTYQFALRRQNRWGLESQNIATWSVQVGDSGESKALPPIAPENITLVPDGYGGVRLRAEYDWQRDENVATHFSMNVRTDGGSAEPGEFGTLLVAVDTSKPVALLDIDLGPYPHGTPVSVFVGMRNTTSVPWVESGNSDIYDTTAQIGSTATTPEAACCYATGAQSGEWFDLWRANGDTWIDTQAGSNVLRFWNNGQLVAAVNANLELLLAGTVQDWSFVDEPQNREVELVGDRIAFAVGPVGSRRRAMEIDASGNLRVASWLVDATFPWSDGERGIRWNFDEDATLFTGARGNVAMALAGTHPSTAALKVRNIIQGVL